MPQVADVAQTSSKNLLSQQEATMGHMVWWYHIRFACGRPFAQIPVCPLAEQVCQAVAAEITRGVSVLLPMIFDFRPRKWSLPLRLPQVADAAQTSSKAVFLQQEATMGHMV